MQLSNNYQIIPATIEDSDQIVSIVNNSYWRFQQLFIEDSPNKWRTNLNEIKNSTANITIYDVTGKVVKTVSTTERTLSIDRGDLRSGIYFIKVMIGDRELSKKIVLE